MHGRVVRLHVPGLLGGGAGGVEILGEERPLGFRGQLDQLARGTRLAALRRPRIHQDDHARTFEAE